MRHRRVLLGAASLGAIAASPVSGQTAQGALEQVVVTASPSGAGIPLRLLGASVSVIDAAALEARQTRIVSDVLRDAPGLAVSRAGGVGGLTQVRIRGGEANHTLVLIDGMLASDPALGEFDFAGLYAEDSARIEVLRGQQPIYGSNAIAGVVHYITATGREAPGFSARVEGGGFNTAQASARYGGVHGPFDVSFSAGYSTTDGTPGARLGVRDLDAKNNTLSGKVIFAPTASFRIIAVGRRADTRADINPSDYASPPSAPTFGLPVDGTDYYDSRQSLGLIRTELDLLGGRWTNGLSLQGAGSRRRTYGDRPSAFTDAGRWKLAYDATFRFDTGDVHNTLTGLVDREQDSFRNLPLTSRVTAQNARQHIANISLVGQYDLDWKGRLGLGVAIRHDDNSRFRDATTYRVQASYLFGAARVRGAVGTGVTNPTFTELYGFDPSNFVGNPGLKPERSRGWEAGIDQALFDGQLRFGATYFASRLHDEIYTVFTPAFLASPANRGSLSKQNGVELTAAARIGARWRLDVAYTHLHATENGVREIRRPADTASVNLAWRSAGDKAGAGVTVRYNGQMTDSYFGAVAQTKVLPSFTLVNLDADIRIGRNLKLYGRVENALDRRYEEVFGYPAPGRAAYAGIRATM